jgi:hypothetical protein
LLKIDPFWAGVDTVFDTFIEAGGEGNIDGI